jgi:hypothetical protein
MNVTRPIYLFFVAIVLSSSAKLKAQQYIPVDIGTHSQMDSSEVYTYGYWFEVQSCFRITGLRVPLEVDSMENVVQIVVFDTVPPTGIASATNEFSTLDYFADVVDTNIIQTDLVVSTGDIIGVFGGGGAEQMVHSMHLGTNNPTINGGQVVFNRLVFEGDLNTGLATAGLYSEDINLGYSRIEMYYDTDVEIVAEFSYGVDLTEVNFYDESNGGDTYLWSFGDGDTSTEQDPIHDYGTFGSYIVTLDVTDICGTDSYTDTIELVSVNVNSVLKKMNLFKVSPNPSNGIVTVKIEGDQLGKIKLYDITGKVLFVDSSDEIDIKYDLSNYPEGIYYLNIGSETKKIVLIGNN